MFAPITIIGLGIALATAPVLWLLVGIISTVTGLGTLASLGVLYVIGAVGAAVEAWA